ncbi:enoyl-CoA hydratase [Caulobacter sp. CCH9-E1]|jgi:enoyl-CoA hydratase/carnithine racemase|uniref:enoyl-CoA hydratase n=1 Tax=Caulobacter sp. CCH9-E1 TaxID=1768768 RepID=UPI00082A350D|nr:enoyl-CoA hydratase [Caulobacter sp. CCH9-E1]
MADYQTLIVETPQSAPGVALIRLNRPEALNALNSQLLGELAQALAVVEADDAVGCIVLTGSAKAFAAGADIKEMSDKTYAQMFKQDFFTAGARAVEQCRKPIIAAVSGYALGGGCELAMMCDFILASDTAKFGQPEVTLGVTPGIGGTQRLTRLVGKSKAMDMILTGRMMDATEAERAGLVSRIFPADALVTEALAVAAKIAAQSPLAVAMNKELVEAAYETTLTTGVALERRLFHSLFAFEDQKEGMAAFVEKRKPSFKGM